MQYRIPVVMPTFDMTQWTRQKAHWATYHRTVKPLAALHGTEHDAWKRNDDGTMRYEPNDAWRAACIESDRLYDLYMRKVKF